MNYSVLSKTLKIIHSQRLISTTPIFMCHNHYSLHGIKESLDIANGPRLDRVYADSDTKMHLSTWLEPLKNTTYMPHKSQAIDTHESQDSPSQW